MASPPTPPITIMSLQGGMNDTDPPNALQDDQCTLAQNVEFFSSTCGERRGGCDPLDMSATGFSGTAMITVMGSSATNWSVIGFTLAPNGVIQPDSSINGGVSASVSSFTASFTLGATANYLTVGVVGDFTTDKVTGVTYNSVAMTQLGKVQGAAGWVYVYGLAAPSTGAHNVVVSASGTCSVLGFWASSYVGCSATQPDTLVVGSASSATGFTSTLTPVAVGSLALQFSVAASATSTSLTGGVIRAHSGGAPFGTIADSNANLSPQTAIVHLSQWFPSHDIGNPELWAVAASPAAASLPVGIARRTNLLTGTLTWFGVTPVDPIIPIAPDIYKIDTQPLNDQLFWAYNSGIDRMHVWDTITNTLRRAGLAQPSAAPTAVNTGSGSYATVRYFRTRWVQRNVTTSQVYRRSEPSLSLAFTASGSGSGALITSSPVIGEGETSWEIEASVDNATFYHISTIDLPTLTYTDSVVYATGYAPSGPTSEAIGAYLLQSGQKYLATDGARLLLAGHYTNPALQSTVAWSPVLSDPGVGNAERQPIVTTGAQAIATSSSLDPSVGGPITGLASGMITPAAYSLATPVSVFYVFKWSRVYMMVSTGDVTAAYKTVTLSTVRGAIPGSVFNGVDEVGAACVYFLDPMFGPSRIGAQGLQMIVGLRTTWKRINLKADVIACGCNYAYKHQAHWWIAVDGSNTPNLRLLLQVSAIQAIDKEKVGRGWSLGTGRSAQALCAEPYTELVSDSGTVSLSTRPFIGLSSPDYIQRTDVDSTDAGQVFSAIIITRPYIIAGLLGRFGTLVGTLLARANSAAICVVRLIRNFGEETSLPTAVSLAPKGLESYVIRNMDDLAITDARVVQLQISDS